MSVLESNVIPGELRCVHEKRHAMTEHIVEHTPEIILVFFREIRVISYPKEQENRKGGREPGLESEMLHLP